MAIESEALTWEINLGRQQPSKRFIVLLAGLASGVFGLVFCGHPMFLVLGPLFVVGSLKEVLFAQIHRLDSKGASVRCGLSHTAIEWENVRRVVESAEGVLLSPLAAPSRLDAFRGVYLRYVGNREDVLAKIRELRGEHEARLLERRTDAGAD